MKHRFDILSKKICGESQDSVDCHHYLNEVLPKLLVKYHPRDIISADETCLYIRHLPDRTLCFRWEKPKGGKKRSEKLTLLLIATMAGRERIKPWVIGHAAKPRRLAGVHKMSVNDLPVKYTHSKRAWMTKDIWKTIMTWLNNYFRAQGRHVLMIVDNASVHFKKGQLSFSNIRLEYLPPHTTAKIQPCDQGVILSLKARFKQRLARHLNKALDDHKPMKKFWNECDVKRACDIINCEWRGMDPERITKSFKRAGWEAARARGLQLDQGVEENSLNVAAPANDRPPLRQEEGDRELWEQITARLDLPAEARTEDAWRRYIEADDMEQVYEELTEEEIAEGVIAEDCDADDEAEEEEEEEEEEEQWTVTNALEAVMKLRNMCQVRKMDEKHDLNLHALESALLGTCCNNNTQSKISNFIKPRIEPPGRQSSTDSTESTESGLIHVENDSAHVEPHSPPNPNIDLQIEQSRVALEMLQTNSPAKVATPAASNGASPGSQDVPAVPDQDQQSEPEDCAAPSALPDITALPASNKKKAPREEDKGGNEASSGKSTAAAVKLNFYSKASANNTPRVIAKAVKPKQVSTPRKPPGDHVPFFFQPSRSSSPRKKRGSIMDMPPKPNKAPPPPPPRITGTTDKTPVSKSNKKPAATSTSGKKPPTKNSATGPNNQAAASGKNPKKKASAKLDPKRRFRGAAVYECLSDLTTEPDSSDASVISNVQ